MTANHSPLYFDDRETWDPEQRERDLFARLPAQLAHAKAHAPAFATLLAKVDPQAVTDRAALAQLPVVRKSELLERQKAARPFGGFAAVQWGRSCLRVFASPGPIYEPEGPQPDYYRLARALWAAGFREGDLVHNTFAYHMTPAGSMMETAAHAIGCTVFPAGVGQTELQVQAIADLQPNAYTGTPSFLRILREKCEATGVPCTFRKALVSGEAFPPALQQELAAAGVDAYQAYATADIGLIAYETAARAGLVVGEDLIVEIVRPGTNEPVPEGEVGEVVVTTLNPTYPLIRFGTGDLSAVIPGRSPCGRTNMRLKGWLGRADQTAKIRGMFVHPAQVQQVVRRFPEITRARLVVTNPDLKDEMTLQCETAGAVPDGLGGQVAAALKEITKLRGSVAFVPAGTLPNDGKVIDDQRQYE
ncbi:phenylacetate--CoA ligase family protein [Hydrogenophilus thermoluteolus]|uniref:Phenylacetate--CoA ligase n=1 Tax=Hydrogenophilus thermoluteolus TaxID=297 RepID=A0A2Z6DVT4_HYDTE|nr:AMP-binding protein [Hydrogenophilus thermoluteolus]BBD76505.1 phenylacetate--CoA ligase [Hydrogenophilus thermoluteolus]GLW60698.1 phenylacetate--CoA ligase [Hydrogenophilus thermoluteolus]